MKTQKMLSENQILEAINSVPTLPSVYQNIIRVMTDKRSTVDDIAEVISKDQAAALKVLKVANSPIFGITRTITTVHDAIMYLGFVEVRNIVVALSVINLVEKNKKFKKFRPRDFWKHSLAVGVASRMIAQYTDRSALDKVFLAGILHDVGKLVLLVYFEDDYMKVLDYIQKNRVFLVEAEKNVLGFTHCEVGQRLLTKWHLADYLVNAVAYHEEGMINGKFDSVVGIVHIANIFARATSLGNPGDNLIPEPNHEIWAKINLPEKFFEEKKDELKIYFNEIVSTILS